MSVTGESRHPDNHYRRILFLVVSLCAYLNLGGYVFSRIEFYEVEQDSIELSSEWTSIEDHVHGQHRANTVHIENKWERTKYSALQLCDASIDILQLGSQLEAYINGSRSQLIDLAETCGHESFTRHKVVRNVSWSHMNAVYFCMTVVSTVGYGHISPTSEAGQVFCIFYALIGIPTSGLLLAYISDFFACALVKFYDNTWRHRIGSSRWSLVSFTVIYVSVGVIILVFVPALAFMTMEGWSYRQSVYYSFITITTIGFGDYVAAEDDGNEWNAIYKTLVILWTFLGLGFWILVLNFLQKVMKSKELMDTLDLTCRIVKQEADEVLRTLQNAGLVNDNGNFVPERSKVALNKMISLTGMLVNLGHIESQQWTNTDCISTETGIAMTGVTARGQSGSKATTRGSVTASSLVPGVHQIGENLSSASVLAALLMRAAVPNEAAAVVAASTVTTDSS